MFAIEHPALVTAMVMGTLTVAVIAIGVAAGWSDGVLGAAFLGVVALGAFVRVFLEPRGDA